MTAACWSAQPTVVDRCYKPAKPPFLMQVWPPHCQPLAAGAGSLWMLCRAGRCCCRLLTVRPHHHAACSVQGADSDCTLGRLAKLSLGRPLDVGATGSEVLSRAWVAAAKFSPAARQHSRQGCNVTCIIFTYIHVIVTARSTRSSTAGPLSHQCRGLHKQHNKMCVDASV